MLRTFRIRLEADFEMSVNTHTLEEGEKFISRYLHRSIPGTGAGYLTVDIEHLPEEDGTPQRRWYIGQPKRPYPFQLQYGDRVIFIRAWTPPDGSILILPGQEATVVDPDDYVDGSRVVVSFVRPDGEPDWRVVSIECLELVNDTQP